jgi:hypothetical protein
MLGSLALAVAIAPAAASGVDGGRHSCLCCFQALCWHWTPQYHTVLQRVHDWAALSRAQAAHTLPVVGGADAAGVSSSAAANAARSISRPKIDGAFQALLKAPGFWGCACTAGMAG